MPKFYTIKRAIIIWQNNNKQVKLLVLGLEFSHGIMIPCFQDLLHLLRTCTNWRKHWFRSKSLQMIQIPMFTENLYKKLFNNNQTRINMTNLCQITATSLPCQRYNTFVQVHNKNLGLHYLGLAEKNLCRSSC